MDIIYIIYDIWCQYFLYLYMQRLHFSYFLYQSYVCVKKRFFFCCFGPLSDMYILYVSPNFFQVFSDGYISMDIGRSIAYEVLETIYECQRFFLSQFQVRRTSGYYNMDQMMDPCEIPATTLMGV